MGDTAIPSGQSLAPEPDPASWKDAPEEGGSSVCGTSEATERFRVGERQDLVCDVLRKMSGKRWSEAEAGEEAGWGRAGVGVEQAWEGAGGGVRTPPRWREEPPFRPRMSSPRY